MEDCYRQLSPHTLEIVDVILFENFSRMEAYSLREQEAVGAYSSGLEASFVATHEAWTGIPRILVCYERFQKLTPLLRSAVLRHEVAHSVLHGSPEYYIFAIPKSLFEASEKHSLSKSYALNILYLTSIGVKDHEATKLLIDHHYVEDQIAYSLYVSKTSEDDVKAWNLSKGDPKREMLCLVGRFKDLACYASVSKKQGWKNIEGSPIREDLQYLPRDLSERLFEISWALNEMDYYDTWSKVELVTNLMVERLMEKIFASQLHLK